MFLLVNTKAKHQQCGHHKDQQEIAPCENLSPVTSPLGQEDLKSTRLNSSHANISYAVFCLKKKKPPWLPTSTLRLGRSPPCTGPSRCGCLWQYLPRFTAPSALVL